MQDEAGPADEVVHAGWLQQLAASLRRLGTDDDIDATLQRTVEFAVEVVDAADLADIMFVRTGEVSTPVATDRIAAELNRAQQDTGEGPCVTALRDQDRAVVHDLEQDERWPRFAPRALELGVRSIAAFRLFGSDAQDQFGALSLFGRRPGFDDHDLQRGEMLAAHCSMVLSVAIYRDGADVTLPAREVIGQAKGILMERHELSPDEAYALLRRAASARHDIPIAVLASQVVTGTTTLRS